MLQRMLNTLVLALAGLAMTAPASAEEGALDQGELVWRDPSCYFFVLKVAQTYSLFEFLGGPSPMVGHIFEGKLNGFGSRKIENKTEGKPTMVYSEVFELKKSQMDKKIPKFCKKRKEFEELAG
ncbi:MAG: hypothetical protein ABL878_14020 [Burkholderiales bacterium]